MKKSILLALITVLAVSLKAQNPVSWTFSSKKVGDKKFEVHMTATIQSGWHLFSQTQPEDAIAIPTGFVINKNPLLEVDGKIKEVGKLEKFHDAKLEVSAHQYADKVDFVQVVKLKANAVTNVNGVVEFQTCNDEKCLPPKKINFSVALK
jgi:hypothetical protein